MGEISPPKVNELCAQQIVFVVPEMKDPMPPIRQDAFKLWVCT